jgi:imidazolonepropionase-like amidohydrolase
MRAVLALLLLGVAPLPAADLALSGATVYVAPDAPPIQGAIVVVHDGKIAAVGPRASVRVPQDAQVIDCSGKFVTAGFWNSHVHIQTAGLLHAHDAKAAELTAELDAMLNRWGFTTVFDLASVLDNTKELRRRVKSGEVRGPHILTVGEPIITEVPIYAKDFLAANHITMPVVKTPEEAEELVASLADLDADGIKLFTGSFQGERVANMPLDMVRAATAEAHRHHLPVFAHPQNTAGLDAAIDGGVDILAHTAPDSPAWTPEFISRLQKAHMALIPTLTLWDVEARKASLKDADREGWMTAMVAQLRAYSQAGGEILFGTDVGYTDHYDTAMEYTEMSRAGMSFPQILASLTTAPAKRFGVASHSGRVAQGMDADLVVLDGDPEKEITALAKVHLVIRGGTTIYANR